MHSVSKFYVLPPLRSIFSIAKPNICFIDYRVQGIKGGSVVSIQQKNGVYYVVLMYRDNLGKKKYKWVRAGKSIKEAERMERRLRTDLDREEITFSKRITVQELSADWINIKIKPKKRPSTIANYEAQIKNINKGLGHLVVQKITARNLETHYNNERQRGLSETSIEYQHAVLRQMLDAAVSWKLITKNPAKEIIDPPQRDTAKKAVYTPEQVQTLLDIAWDTDMCLPVVLGFLCGLRRGEICGLRDEDVNFREKFAFIQYSLDRMPKNDASRLSKSGKVVWYGAESKTGTVLALGPVKTDESEGYIPLSTLVVNQLRMEFLAKVIQMERFGPSYQDNGFVWAWEDGRPHDPDYFYHAFKKLISKHNEVIEQNENLSPEEKKNQKLPDISPHNMRHTHATLLLRKKVDPKLVSKKLRHKRASFTQDYYQHVQNDMQSVTATAMDEMFKNPTIRNKD